ncbi:hypothetical protein CsatB_010525 [Cannabis sativa]
MEEGETFGIEKSLTTSGKRKKSGINICETGSGKSKMKLDNPWVDKASELGETLRDREASKLVGQVITKPFKENLHGSSLAGRALSLGNRGRLKQLENNTNTATNGSSSDSNGSFNNSENQPHASRVRSRSPEVHNLPNGQRRRFEVPLISPLPTDMITITRSSVNGWRFSIRAPLTPQQEVYLQRVHNGILAIESAMEYIQLNGITAESMSRMLIVVETMPEQLRDAVSIFLRPP